MMPKVNGAELVARMAADPRTAAIPVIMMSAGYTRVDDQRVVAFFIKPVQVRELFESIRAILER